MAVIDEHVISESARQMYSTYTVFVRRYCTFDVLSLPVGAGASHRSVDRAGDSRAVLGAGFCRQTALPVRHGTCICSVCIVQGGVSISTRPSLQDTYGKHSVYSTGCLPLSYSGQPGVNGWRERVITIGCDTSWRRSSRGPYILRRPV